MVAASQLWNGHYPHEARSFACHPERSEGSLKTSSLLVGAGLDPPAQQPRVILKAIIMAEESLFRADRYRKRDSSLEDALHNDRIL
jgi:hypothetical protein